ncbi:CDC27 family protein, partial [Phenylobacterium sp.]|uniref:CDC27 family protein n=1 Tax=Phenylobacterium sp. TaxID=1871053 RepID=UPI0039833A58
MRASLEVAVREGRFGPALALCDPLRRQSPTDPWLATVQAYSHFKLGQHENAVVAAAEAVGLDAGNPTAAFVLGASNRNLGRHAEAARALLSAYELLPDRADIAVLLLEETVTAQGLGPARPLFQRISARVADRRIAASWARL